jgi:hypothetical protein
MRASSLSLSPDSVDDIPREAERARSLGVQYLICGWPGQGRGRIDEFARRIMPQFIG